MLLLLLVHFTSLLYADVGLTVLLNVIFEPFNTEFAPDTFILDTGVHSTNLYPFSDAKTFAAVPEYP